VNYRSSVEPESPSLVAEANAPDTSASRLLELTTCEDREVSVAALGRLIRMRWAEDVLPVAAKATDPDAQVAVALGLVLEALRLLPGRVIAMDSERISAAMFSAGWAQYDQFFISLLDGMIASRGDKFEELARGMADSWTGTLGELLDVVEILHAPYEESQ
jgi:hypothetical protein